MLLTCAHVAVPGSAQQGDLIGSPDLAGRPLGVLRAWTGFAGSTTVDAALIWVDPALVSGDLQGLGPMGSAPNTFPAIGDEVWLFAAGVKRVGAIAQMDADIDIEITTPGWNSPVITYRKQIVCRPRISELGDSGSVVVGTDGRIIGLVVGQGLQDDETYITPIDAVLNHSDWAGKLSLAPSVPAGVVAPPQLSSLARTPSPPVAPPPVPPPSRDSATFAALVPGGFFSSEPFNHAVPRSIRTNNPGALNWSSWQVARPGYAGKTEADGSANHNVTTIYRTPEHGVASWYHLLAKVYGYASHGSFTLADLARRYAGAAAGPAVDGYLKGWGRGSGNVFKADHTFSLDEDDDMLALGKAMFFNEIGKPSPVHDEQILFAIAHERAGTIPA